MKKQLALLILIITIGMRAQVYDLEYTHFQFFDTIHQTYFAPYDYKVEVRVDLKDSTIRMYDSEQKGCIFNLRILNILYYKGGAMSDHCIDVITGQKWDVHFYVQDNYNIFQGKSGNELWIFKSLTN